MDTHATSAQAKMQNAQNANTAGAGNAKTGSTDFMDLITKQLAAQRAAAREQDAADNAARKQSMRAQDAKYAKTQSERLASSRAQSQKAADARRQEQKDRADAASAKKSASPAPQAKSSDEANAQTQAAQTQTAQADAADDAALPADLQKLLEEIAAQLQTTKQNSPFATQEAEASASQANGQELAGNAQNAQTLALLSPAGKQKLLDALQSLMNGLPASQRPTVETLEKGILKTLDSDNLTADAADADTTADGTSALIVSGLTPQQLTDLMKKLKEGNQDDSLSAGNVMINLVQLTPVPDAKKDVALFQPSGSILATQSRQTVVDLTTKAGGGKDGGKDAESFQLTALLSQAGPDGASGTDTTPKTSFDHILRMLELARQDNGGGHIANTDKADGKTPDITAGNSVLPTALSATGDINELFTVDSIFPDGTGLATTTTAYGSVVSVGLSSTAPMTSLTTTASPQAVYAHPATQEVAATLVKQAGEGESTAMTLRLDPPELGKIAVKMEFSTKDKAVKAVISADKPETYMMLQRDSHVLQNALRDAGLDVGQNSLSFELSQDGSTFGQQNRGGQNNSGGYSSGNDTMDIAIETKMDWSVGLDGNWHYNVLA